LETLINNRHEIMRYQRLTKGRGDLTKEKKIKKRRATTPIQKFGEKKDGHDYTKKYLTTTPTKRRTRAIHRNTQKHINTKGTYRIAKSPNN